MYPNLSSQISVTCRHFGLHLVGDQNLVRPIDLVRFDKILEQNMGDKIGDQNVGNFTLSMPCRSNMD